MNAATAEARGIKGLKFSLAYPDLLLDMDTSYYYITSHGEVIGTYWGTPSIYYTAFNQNRKTGRYVGGETLNKLLDTIVEQTTNLEQAIARADTLYAADTDKPIERLFKPSTPEPAAAAGRDAEMLALMAASRAARAPGGVLYERERQAEKEAKQKEQETKPTPSGPAQPPAAPGKGKKGKGKGRRPKKKATNWLVPALAVGAGAILLFFLLRKKKETKP